MADSPSTTKVEEAVEFLRHSNDADSENRQLALQALKFSYGDQWPQYAAASRGLDRPQLVVNEVNTYIKKITNAQRQARPRGKASPIDSFADKKIAKIITGIGKHCEINSDADSAYDTAFDFSARMGWGYWRLRTDYISEDSRKQDIYIDVVQNPFAVYFDPNSRLPDGSDAEGALITDKITIAAFEKMYPGAQTSGFDSRGTGDSDPDWITEKDIRLAEYYCIDRKKAKLIYLSDGTDIFEDQLPPGDLLAQVGISIIGDRDSYKRVVKWRKQTAVEILEERDLPGRWIPVIPTYWTNTIVDNKRLKFGLVKDAKDPQIIINFMHTAIIECLALATKAKWLIPEGADEGHENEFRNANLSPSATLHYKPTGVDGQPIAAPERIQPEPPPSGFIEGAFLSSNNLSRVMGTFDPAVRGGAQHKSDKTLNAERAQSENANFDGFDNFTRSLKHSWRVMLSWMPTTFDTQRVQRIVGDDGRDSLVTINERTQQPSEDGGAIEKVLNDIRIGTYDVVMETGPGYDTLRQEGVATMMQLLDTPLGEKVAQTGDDIIVREMDFNGSDVLADRLAAANPLSQIDEKSEVPPKVQMQIKGMQQQLQQSQQVIQQLQGEIKSREGVEKIKQAGATQRTLMQETSKAHGIETERLSKEHDVEARAITSQNVAEINGLVRILTSNSDKAHDMRKMIATFEHETNQMNAEQQMKHDEQSFQPLQ